MLQNWMVDELDENGYLVHADTISKIQERFGHEFV